MSAHGGRKGASLASLRLPRPDGRAGVASRGDGASEEAVRTATSAVAAHSGFRNFGASGLAAPDEIFTGYGSPWETQTLLGKLMLRMTKLHTFPDGKTSSRDENFNPKIPAGYTYLAQFAAHDIVSNSALLTTLSSSEAGRNLRQRALLLDTLYDAGPVFSEAAYQTALAGEDYRTMLRTGKIGQPFPKVEEGQCPFHGRDIPRLSTSQLSDRPQLGLPDVLIPDQRNDDNALVAQMTALFHLIHNAVVTSLRKLGNQMPRAGEDGPAGLHLFLNARRLTTALYRRVISADLLEHLLAPDIWKLYVTNGLTPLADLASQGIPLEFSHAAYRLGHSMVRMSYTINDAHPQGEGIEAILKTRSASRSHKFPPATDWIADWSKFFDINSANPPQPSRRIGPCFNDMLITEGAFSNSLVGPNGQLLTPEAAAALSSADRAKLPDPLCSGLLLRDLIRGSIGGLLKLDVLLGHIRKKLGSLPQLLDDPGKRQSALRSWLKHPEVDFSDAELDQISANPPLILWLLFEAAEECNGMSLGTLSSIIVGDVFTAQLAATRLDIEFDAMTEKLLKLVFPDGPPDRMPELIRFTAAALGLENAVPTFATLS